MSIEQLMKEDLLALFDHMPYMMSYKDVKGRFIMVNQRFADSCGFTKSEIIGRTDFDIWPEPVANAYNLLDKKVIDTKTEIVAEELMTVKQGKIWFETFKKPILDEYDGVMGILSTFHNISKRKHFQIEQEQQKSFLQSMLNAIPDMVFYKDSSGVYLGCNDAFATKIMGLPEEGIIGHTDLELLSDTQQAEHFMQQDAKIIETGMPIISEEFNQLVDGSIVCLETAKTPFDNQDGTVAGIIGIARDIDHRKRGERLLREQQEYAEMLLKTIPSAVYTIDVDGKITSWNMMAELITGYDAEMVMGHEACKFPFFIDFDTESVLLNEGQMTPVKRTREIKTRSGESKFIMKAEGLIRNDAGTVTGRIECFDDITERIMIEQRLKDSELRLHLATASAGIGLWDWHVQTGQTVFNEEWAAILGYRLDEIEPVSIQTWIDYTHPDDLEQSNQLLKRHFSKELDNYECEARMKHKNGEWVWVLDRGRVTEWDGETPIRMLGTHIDITSRKHIEDDLRRKERILSAVAMSIRILIENRDYMDAIVQCFEMIGNATMVDRVYLFTNQYDLEGNGYTSQMIEWNSGVEAPQLKNPDLQDLPMTEVEGFIAPLLKGEAYFNRVSQIKDNRTRALLEEQNVKSIVVLPIFVREIFWGFMGFDECKYEREWTEAEFSTLIAFSHSIEKIVERKLIEEELEESRRFAETANVLKSQFVANMSHEIRTPMHAILGYAELLKDQICSDEGRLYLNSIQKAGGALMNLLNDILDLSKIEAGKLEIQTSFVEVRKIIEDVRDLFALKAEEKGIKLSVNIDSRLPSVLQLDEMRFRQILFNLVGNAVKFTQEGSVAINVEVTKFSEDNTTLDMLTSVRDTGIGIPESQYAAIFEPFKQQDGQSTKKYGGSGLGLSISKRLAELMGGTIHVTSMPGKGTKFSVEMNAVPVGKVKLGLSENETFTAINNLTDDAVASHDTETPLALQKELEYFYKAVWQSGERVGRVADIKAIADALDTIALGYNNAALTQYTAQLKGSIQSYDLKRMKNILDNFPQLLAQLEGRTRG